MNEFLYDKNGIPILKGDVLKVFHFIGARREKHFMYKQVLGFKEFGKNKSKYMELSHLDLESNSYFELIDGRILKDYEIVQGFGDDGINFKKRKNRKKILNYDLK